MSIIGWLVLGLIAGFVASKIVNKTGEGVILDIVLGIVGAVVGGFLFALSVPKVSVASISTACLSQSSARSWCCSSTMLLWDADAFDVACPANQPLRCTIPVPIFGQLRGLSDPGIGFYVSTQAYWTCDAAPDLRRQGNRLNGGG